jgi:hypothetical protein
MSDRAGKALGSLVRAIRDPGRVPRHHWRTMAKHRREWPVLWEAIDELVAAYDNEGHGHETE